MNVKTHFRRCHICGTANSAEGDLVTACECCGKHLAPFYFFDESRAMGLTDSSFCSAKISDDMGVKATERETESVLPHKEYPPVWGLTVYWES